VIVKWQAALLILAAACGRESPSVRVFAAASLRRVMPELVERFRETRSGVEVDVAYGASGDLRRRAEQGDPVDVLLVVDGPGRPVASNRMALVGPPPAITLATLGPQDRLAIGDPEVVPAGANARSILEQRGLWGPLQARLVLAGDVAAALALARRGAVRVAIVYATDARGLDDVAAFEVFEAPRPTVVAVAQGSGLGRELADFVASPAGQAILAAHGFGPPPEAP
jgi:molybdate transport system substrate-binding protein